MRRFDWTIYRRRFRMNWRNHSTRTKCRIHSRILLTYLLLALNTLHIVSSTWWSLSQMPLQTLLLYGSGAICDGTPGLLGQQRRLCRAEQDVMISVAAGAKLAVKECQKQLRNNRWNCSTSGRDASVFGKVALQGSRETAMVHAITSAGVVHTITRACSKGELPRCACDETKEGRQVDKQGRVFTWGGCSDNVVYSNKFTRLFVDAREKVGRDARALMNLHNNGAGRRAVKKHMQLQCKCHGVSGSCTTRTCWLAMQDFRSVGTQLRMRYNGATQVMMSQEGKLIVANKAHKKPTRSDLVYLEESPDYCLYDPKTGSMGTAGRQCKKSSLKTDGCDIMCCGRGYDTISVQLVRKCECKFHWCCAVKCKDCYRQTDIHTCKGGGGANAISQVSGLYQSKLQDNNVLQT